MNGSIVVTPGYIFRNNQDITTANLNSWTTPTAVLEDQAITKYEIDYEVLGPEVTSITTTGASTTWVLDASRVVHTLDLTLDHNTTISFTNIANGMYGIIYVYDSSGTKTLTMPSGWSNLSNPPAATTRSIIEFVYLNSALHWRRDTI